MTLSDLDGHFTERTSFLSNFSISENTVYITYDVITDDDEVSWPSLSFVLLYAV